MYTIRNINKIYASGEAQIVLSFTLTNPFNNDSIVNETVSVPNGATMTDADLLAQVISIHKLDPTTISFDTYVPPPVAPSPES